jgi:hypothetical protein
VYAIVAATAACAVLLYWRRFGNVAPTRPRIMTCALALAGLAACVWSAMLARPSYSYARHASPLAVAIAFDLSPSMLAIPDPVYDEPLPPRHRRARDALLEVFATLEERGIEPRVSFIGFTAKAAVLTGWDDDTMQIREMLGHGLSPGLFTSSGTSIEAAVEALIDAFDLLPDALQDASRKIAILVSDGEDTTGLSYQGYIAERLGAASFDVIALQTGSLASSEGVPHYGEAGEFLGFERMSGRLHTIPDANAMTSVTRAAARGGLYVRAEEPTAAAQMLRYLDRGQGGAAAPRGDLAASLLLFTVVAVLCARIVH